MKYSAERIYVRFWNVDDAALLLDLQVRNRGEIENISASDRDESFYSLEGQRSLIESWNKKREEGNRYSFGIFYIQRMNSSVKFLCSRSYWILPQNGSLVI
ncbi:hypothetical protein [Paenibacillus sp. FSL R5-0486]|uniref:hypothetical protein n=1 Tax=Paenibacillus sp. FSL R5-0486 TaxID=2921645 RepID=UPI0030DADB6F